jgi:hypothetical protein
MSSSFSRSYAAGLAAVLAAFGALGLLLTGERPAGLGAAEPLGLGVAAVLFVLAGTAYGSVAASVWIGLAGVIVVAVLGFLALGGADRSSVLFLEAAAVVCGGVFVGQASRGSERSAGVR